MQFLLCYSNPYNAKERGLPLAGTAVELASFDDLFALQTRLKHELILHGPTYFPVSFEWFDPEDHEWNDERHQVRQLPEGYKTARWLEVYNGYRE
jgi:hypothetical protein